jgi:hypothetical protein
VFSRIKVDQCGICYWDEVSGQVITMGYYPPERRDPVNSSYLLADYPECERSLLKQVSVVLEPRGRVARSQPGLEALPALAATLSAHGCVRTINCEGLATPGPRLGW